jgi:hypothetical protein
MWVGAGWPLNPNSIVAVIGGISASAAVIPNRYLRDHGDEGQVDINAYAQNLNILNLQGLS